MAGKTRPFIHPFISSMILRNDFFNDRKTMTMKSRILRYEEMSSLISSLSSHVKRNYPDTFCKNALLNTLLQEKKAIADRLEINCQFRILLPESFDCVFSDITITSLFSNLLDNAIEACELCNSEEKKPFISLTTNFKANVFMIHMQNSKNPEEIFTHQTNKTQNSALHAHGVRNRLLYFVW